MDPGVQKKLEEFFSKYKLLTLKKGEVLITPDNSVTSIYYLKKGYIHQYVISEEGEEITINMFRPPSFIPMMLAITGSQNRYYFETADKVEVWQAPSDKTIEFVKNEPAVLFDLTRRFGLGLNGITQRLESLMFENAQSRIISLLSYLSERFGEKTKEGVLVNLPLTHQDIAGWVNLTRETTSRQLEELTKAGIISYKNHYITVKNLNSLRPTK